MGIRGLWDLVLPTVQHRSLREIATAEGFVCNRHGSRTIIIGIDASIWLSQSQHAFKAGHWQAGENPELRAIFFKLASLLRLPVTPLFVFDGPGRPETKRGVKVVTKSPWMTFPLQEILDAFQYQYYTAPGEAEAELAQLNRARVIDAVMTEDSDVLVFGATHVIRGWTAKNDNVDVYTAEAIATHKEVSLTCGGMLLIALLSGNDYNINGLRNIGPKISRGLAHAGLGDALLSAALDLPDNELARFLSSWRQALRNELATNESNLLPQRYPLLAERIPDEFPQIEHLRYHAMPKTSFTEDSAGPNFSLLHPRPPDIARLAKICERRFGWANIVGGVLEQFKKYIWPGICIQMLCCQDLVTSSCIKHPLGPTAIQRIRMSRVATGFASGLVDYRVDFATHALDSVVETVSGTSQSPLPLCSVWVPASMLNQIVPQLVATYQTAHRTSQFSSRKPSFERIFTTPPVQGSRGSSCELIELSDSSDDEENHSKTAVTVIDLT